MGKRVICFLLTGLLLCLPAFAAPAPELSVDAKAAILYEVSTDTVLFEQNADDRLYPASTTKLLTALIAMEYGNPADTVTVTSDAVDGLWEQGSSSYLLPGEEISFMDLLRYMLVASGNDAANAMAIHISGSKEAFAELMNSTALELGCTNSHFTNPNGLHDENHYTSARDLLLIAKAAMANSTIAEIVAQDEVTLPVTNKHSATTTKYTTNYLISKKSTGAYFYEGANGIKTGTTTPAGLCLIGSCVKGEYTYYSVVLGAEKMADGSSGQFVETANLFRYGEQNFSKQIMLNASEPIAEVPVRLSEEKNCVIATPSESIAAMLPNTFEASDLEIQYTVEESVDAPVRVGDVLGTMTASYGGKEYHLNLIASSDASRSTTLYVLDRVKTFLTSKIFRIVVGCIVGVILLFIGYVLLVNRKRIKRRRNRKRK